MQLTIDVKDNKAEFVKELLSNFKFIKVKSAKKTAKEEFLEELEDAVHNLNLVKVGKKKSRSLKSVLNEL
ncbi:MAG: hypothetical protein RIQ33_2254 [Bacteroidota bacterium]|jgi:hypothetical protein